PRHRRPAWPASSGAPRMAGRCGPPSARRRRESDPAPPAGPDRRGPAASAGGLGQVVRDLQPWQTLVIMAVGLRHKACGIVQQGGEEMDLARMSVCPIGDMAAAGGAEMPE